MRRTFCAIAFATILISVSPFVSLFAAQEQGVWGTVTDATGGVIVGASVTLDGPSGRHREVLTTSLGEFSFPSLEPGTYQIRITASGFAEFQQSIEFPESKLPLNVTLQVEISDRVDVSTMSATLGSAGVLSTTTISGAALAALPDDPHSLLARLQELAGATGNSAQIDVWVDGFRQTVQLPPKEAIQMIRISLNPFAPEFAELARARIEVITKPGSATVHAELRGTFNDAEMNARNPLAARRAEEQTHYLSGYVSGPVIPNRWSFVAYAGSWSIDQTNVVNASGIDPFSGNIVPLSETVVTPTRLTNVWLGNDLRLSDRHILSLSAGLTKDRADNRGLESGLDLPERSYASDGDFRELRMSMTSVLTSRLLNEVRALVSRRHTTIRADDPRPAILVLDAFNGGGNQSFLFNEARIEGLQFIERLTATVGRHMFKLGVDVDGAEYRRLDMGNFGGTFVFGADFERDRLGEPMLNENGEWIAISPLENYRRTLLGIPGYRPSQFSITRGTPDVLLRQWWSGWFAQDDWIVHPRLTLSYGVRQEWQTELAGPDAAARGAIAWAVDGSRRNTVRAGGGIYFRRVEPELTLDVLRSGGDRLRQMLILRPGFFPNVPADLSEGVSVLPTFYVRAPELNFPRTLRLAVGFERQLPKNGFLTLSYDVQDGDRQLRTLNTNAPDLDGRRPDPARGPVLQYESTGHLRRHELSAGFRWQPTPRVSGFVNYSYIHGRSDTDGRSTVPADSRRLDAEFGYALLDLPHQASMGASIGLPWGVGVNPYVTIASGRAFNITTGFDNNGDGLFADRPAVGTAGGASVIETPYGLFNTTPGPNDQIILRNAGREPLQVRVDLNVMKSLRIGTAQLYTAVDVENLINRANFAGINGVLTSPSFGRPNVALNPRRVSVSCGFSF
jgi:Carboxypeptidase regulatory-like domain